jgi:DnaJ-class molecular chaperone
MRGPVIRDVPRCVLHGRSREKVPRTATADDIKKSFREPAKKLHLDVNRNPHATALFAELNSDHEILSDEVKRHAFDRREIVAEGGPAW